MDRLYRSELIHRLSIEHRDPKFVRIHDIPTIPDQIRTFADAIEHYGNLLGPKRKIRGHTWKARIVAMVIEDTHKPHDPEVSGLIAFLFCNTSATLLHDLREFYYGEIPGSMTGSPL
jgi:hypothetical protein